MRRTLLCLALCSVSFGARAQDDARKVLIGTWHNDVGQIEVTDRGIVHAMNEPDASVVDSTAPANFTFSMVRGGGEIVNCAYAVEFVSKDRTVWRDVTGSQGGACPAGGAYERGEG